MQMRARRWWPLAAALSSLLIAGGVIAGAAIAASHPSIAPPARSHATTAAAAGDDAIWETYPSGPIKATGSIQVLDAKIGNGVTCTSAKLAATLQGVDDSGTGIGSITSASFTGCTIGKVSVTVTAHGLPWTMNGTGYDVKTGVSTGTIAGIDLVATGTGCSATLDGTAAGAGNGEAAFTYTNPSNPNNPKPEKMALGSGGNLHWWAVSGCSGQVGTGDPGQASGSLTVTPATFIEQNCDPYRQGIKLNPIFPVPSPLPGSHKSDTPGDGCAYIAGFTNARKLDEAAPIGPAYVDLVIGIATYLKQSKSGGTEFIQINNAGLPQYHGLTEFAPSRATLLGFGFMPVSATIQLSEDGTLNAIARYFGKGVHGCKPGSAGFCGTTAVISRLSLRIYDVTVNGKPLNVGSHCQTAAMFDVKLTGPFPEYQIETGGPLYGTVNIPPFTGCGADGDDLDPIFTATVSGPGNESLLTQGPPCAPYSGATVIGCPAAKPTPIHSLSSGS